MIRFAHPEYLMFLIVVPIIGAMFWLVWYLKRKSVLRYGSQASIYRMVHFRSRVKFWLRAGVFMLAAAALITAYANPKIGTKFQEVTRSGIDLIVAVDASNSMSAEDIKPNRIAAAKREIATLINNLKGDRIGIIVFAGEAYTQLPLTTDYSAALLLLDVVYTGSAPRAGTSVGTSIKLGMESFTKSEGKYKAMIVITDGESHEDNPVDAAEDAAKEGIVIHTIGMGSTDGAPIPVYRDRQMVGYRKDREGRVVTTRLNEEVLKSVAAATGGTYTRATNARDNLALVFQQIEKMEKRDMGTKEFTEFEDRFQYLIGFGLLLLVVEIVLSEKRNKFLSRFAIFSPKEENGNG